MPPHAPAAPGERHIRPRPLSLTDRIPLVWLHQPERNAEPLEPALVSFLQAEEAAAYRAHQQQKKQHKAAAAAASGISVPQVRLIPDADYAAQCAVLPKAKAPLVPPTPMSLGGVSGLGSPAAPDASGYVRYKDSKQHDAALTGYDMGDVDDRDLDWLRDNNKAVAKGKGKGKGAAVAGEPLSARQFEDLVTLLERTHFDRVLARKSEWEPKVLAGSVPSLPKTELLLPRKPAVATLLATVPSAPVGLMDALYSHWVKQRSEVGGGPLLQHLWFEHPWKAVAFPDEDHPELQGDPPFVGTDPNSARNGFAGVKGARISNLTALEEARVLISVRRDLDMVRTLLDQTFKRERIKRQATKAWVQQATLLRRALKGKGAAAAGSAGVLPASVAAASAPPGSATARHFGRHALPVPPTAAAAAAKAAAAAAAARSDGAGPSQPALASADSSEEEDDVDEGGPSGSGAAAPPPPSNAHAAAAGRQMRDMRHQQRVQAAREHLRASAAFSAATAATAARQPALGRTSAPQPAARGPHKRHPAQQPPRGGGGGSGAAAAHAPLPVASSGRRHRVVHFKEDPREDGARSSPSARAAAPPVGAAVAAGSGAAAPGRKRKVRTVEDGDDADDVDFAPPQPRSVVRRLRASQRSPASARMSGPRRSPAHRTDSGQGQGPSAMGQRAAGAKQRGAPTQMGASLALSTGTGSQSSQQQQLRRRSVTPSAPGSDGAGGKAPKACFIKHGALVVPSQQKQPHVPSRAAGQSSPKKVPQLLRQMEVGACWGRSPSAAQGGSAAGGAAGRKRQASTSGVLQELPLNKFAAVHCTMKRGGAAQALTRRTLTAAVARSALGAAK